MAERNSEEASPDSGPGSKPSFARPHIAQGVTDARNLDALFIPGGWARHTERLAMRTIINYRYYWTTFVDWCESRALSALPAEQTTVLEFIKSRLDPSNPRGAIRKKTADIIVGAIAHANMQLTEDWECVQSARNYLKTIEDPPIDLQIATRHTLDAFLASLPESLKSVRIKCVLLLIYEELLHTSEIVALTLEGYARLKGRKESFLRYRSVITKEVDWHPLTPCSAAAIEAWIAAARIKHGPMFPRMNRGGTLTTRAMTKETLEHAISEAHARWSGPRVGALSIRRGRVADGLQLEAEGESRPEQWRRNIVWTFQPMQLGWKDEPPAMSKMSLDKLRERTKRDG